MARLELIEDSAVVSGRVLTALVAVAPAMILVGLGLTARISVRGTNGSLLVIVAAVSFGFFGLVTAISIASARSRARKMPGPTVLFTATWNELRAFGEPGSEPSPYASDRILNQEAGVLVALGDSEVELVWPVVPARRTEVSLTLADDVTVRLWVDGIRVGRIQFQQGERAFVSSAKGRLNPFPSHAVRIGS